jgi:ferritin-like metal-binding protein YciE
MAVLLLESYGSLVQVNAPLVSVQSIPAAGRRLLVRAMHPLHGLAAAPSGRRKFQENRQIGEGAMKMDSLKDLYVDQLRDLYSAENQILKALPKMAEKASHPELKTAFQEHEQQTREQVRRLEQVFDTLGEKPAGHHCKGMEGLLKEGDELMKMKVESDVLDAGLITSAQRVEHYEIAGYGTVRTFARQLGLDDQAEILQRTLDEEGNTDERLTMLAERVVNRDAMR